MTVLGSVPVEDMGITLTHEHILSDCGYNGPAPEEASRKFIFYQPMNMEILGEIAIDLEINADEEKSLRGASRAARQTQVPLSVDLPGAVPQNYAPWVALILSRRRGRI